MKIIDALDKGNLILARNLLLQEVYSEVDDKNSWHSPNYIASDKVKHIQKNIILDSERDKLLTFFGLQVLVDRYFLRDADGNIVETPQKFFSRVAAGLCDGDGKFAQQLYDAISKLWFMPATPILTNISTDKGNLISCFLQYMGDSIKDIYKTVEECAFLGSGGGGLGVYMGDVRGQGAKIKKTMTSSGTIPFMNVLDANTLAITQGGVRRASAAIYLDISHPDIEEFVDLRKPTGGDENRRCLNLHHGVNITDSFMEAVNSHSDWDLVCPHTKKAVKSISAFNLWTKILTNRVSTGEPYIHFIDTTNKAILPEHEKRDLFVKQSNLCVTGDTKILTTEGYICIKELVNDREFSITEFGGEVFGKGGCHVWNGEQWSYVKPVKTGSNQEIRKVYLSDGTELECTPYHKFYIQEGYSKGTGNNKLKVTEKRTHELKTGDKLIKCDFPLIQRESSDCEYLESPYTQGFFSGDGCNHKGKNHIYLYGEKIGLIEFLDCYKVGNYSPEQDRVRVKISDKFTKFYVPNINHSPYDRLRWLAGLADSDGCVTDNEGCQSLQISNTNKKFLLSVKLMLNELGVSSKVTLMHEARDFVMPDGKGSEKEYQCKPVYRLLVGAYDLYTLIKLGFKPNRLKLKENKPNRKCTHFVKVIDVVDEGKRADTYCFTEPKKGKGVFNGVLTGNCSEITLPTDDERTAVCCLGSINVEQCPESLLAYVSGLATEALDNVLSIFIHKADKRNYKRAINSASKERSIGLGLMGWHGYLMKNKIPFESVTAIAKAAVVQETIQNAARLKSEELAIRKGDCEDNPGYRNSYLTAIAPTANISVIAGGATPCIEPIAGNAYLQKTLSGSFLVKNKYLEALLDVIGKNDAKTWKSITRHKGSVQHLDFLSEEEKKLFKTGYELDQRFIIRQAAARQKHLCQAQSLNLFFAIPDGGLPAKYLNEVHLMAHNLGVKSLYYLRSESVLGFKIDYDECSACQ